HVAPTGRGPRPVRAPLGDVATGAGAVWLPRASSVLRLDERTGRVRTLATGPLRLGGFQHDLAAGDDALWALGYQSRTRSKLVRFDPHTGGRTGTASLPGIADAPVVNPLAPRHPAPAVGGPELLPPRERDRARDGLDRRRPVRLVLRHLPGRLDPQAEEVANLADLRADTQRPVRQLLRLDQGGLPERVL